MKGNHQGYNGNANTGKSCLSHTKPIDRSGAIIGGGNGTGPTGSGNHMKPHNTSAVVIGSK